MAPRKPTPAGPMVQPDPSTPAPTLPSAQLSRVEISLDQHGKGRVIVNGVDLSKITQSLRMRASVHSLPMVTLRLIPRELVIVADAVVQPTCLTCADKLRNITTSATVHIDIRPGDDDAVEDGALRLALAAVQSQRMRT